MTFYHGGPGGLSPGDVILPPAGTDAQTIHQVLRQHDQLLYQIACGRDDYQSVAVYVAEDDWALACIFAALWTLTPWQPGDGSVYEVRPEGEMTRDPDTECGVAWRAEQAVVEHVDTPRVPRGWVMANVPGARRTDRLLRELHHARETGEPIDPGHRLDTLVTDKMVSAMPVPPSPVLQVLGPAVAMIGGMFRVPSRPGPPGRS